jgi:predicted enzyme related to lactoylglutathione lyase
MADKVTWFELPADDTARAGKFYTDVFGWNMSDMGGGSLAAQSVPSGDDLMPLEPGVINGDISPRSQAFDKPLIVITVEDMKAKIDMVKEAGGKVALEPQQMEGMNMLWAIVTDTEGNNIGVIQDL